MHRLAHTYSIVALEKKTGRLGVAVQSHCFGVGPIVPWVESGVGAVATQAMAEVSYGPLGLKLLRAGKTAQQSMAALLAADDEREVRQVAMVDAAGNVAVHTGEKCIAEAGHRTGDGYSVQANLMLNDRVPDAMVEAFEGTHGDLLERLVSTLEAAEDVGGDIRGRQSTAVVIAPGHDEAEFGYGRNAVELRIDDHKQPLVALRRLVSIHRGYRWIDKANVAIEEGDLNRAEELYAKMRGLAVGSREPMFWYAVTLVNEGHAERALPVFREVFAHDNVWLEVVERLVPAGLFSDDKKLLKKVRAVAR